MNDIYYIEKISKEVEEKLKWKKIALWTDNDYKKLSHLIQEDTNISISPQTLKRLFGKVKYKVIYNAQPATKDALVMFLGYKDWSEFVSEKENKEHLVNKFQQMRNILNTHKKIFISIVVVAAIIIVISILIFLPREKNVLFYAESYSGTSPFTVSIHYDISQIKGHDVFIDFDEKEAEDSLTREKLDKNRTVINHCFESPGLYNVALWVNGKVLSSFNVHVVSDEWTSYYFQDDNFSHRKFIFTLENRIKDEKDDGLLYISPKDIIDKGFNGNSVYYLEHLLYKDFMVCADSCELEVKYENSPETGGISCYDIELRIIGETGLISVLLVEKGCFRWSEVIVGDFYLNGKYNDLKGLSTDLLSWNLMNIQIKNGKALIVNDNDTLLSCSYKQPIGLIKGIRFVTKGSGKFDYMKLFDSNGALKYDDKFDN
jgi:hypothetical protein